MSHWLTSFASVTATDLNAPNVQASGANLGAILQAAFIAAGAVAVVFLIIGGLRYITSNGDSGEISKAKESILYAIVGIIITITASLIVQFIGDTVK